ncbi:hypothetical protein ACWELO_02135 [Streptomyces sp. NPDC004596]
MRCVRQPSAGGGDPPPDTPPPFADEQVRGSGAALGTPFTAQSWPTSGKHTVTVVDLAAHGRPTVGIDAIARLP